MKLAEPAQPLGVRDGCVRGRGRREDEESGRAERTLLQAEIGLALLRDEKTQEGETIRRFYDLKLARHRSPVFALTFTVMHAIDRDSPLHGATAASLQAQNAELVVTGTGIDETMAQPVHVRTSYLSHEILWDHRFVDLFGWTEDGRRVIDYRQFHDTVPLSAGRQARAAPPAPG